MSKDNHKIDADDQNVFEVLNEKNYTVDYFQREYPSCHHLCPSLRVYFSNSDFGAMAEGAVVGTLG